MGRPLTIQPEDDERLQALKEDLGAPTKIDVLRRALDSLEQALRRKQRLERLSHAARLVSRESAKVNKDFQTRSFLKKAW